MSQQLNSRDDAVLAKGKATHAMIASRTQPPRTLIALNHRGILGMVATVHHLDFTLPHRFLRPLLSGLPPDVSLCWSLFCFGWGGGGGVCSRFSFTSFRLSGRICDWAPVFSASARPAS